MKNSPSRIYSLNAEELELAEEIVQHEGWNVLLRIIEKNVADIEAQIHTIQPNSKDCGTILLIERSKAVGARNLLTRIKNLKGSEKA